jgi:hypothetical protein
MCANENVLVVREGGWPGMAGARFDAKDILLVVAVVAGLVLVGAIWFQNLAAL